VCGGGGALRSGCGMRTVIIGGGFSVVFGLVGDIIGL